MNKKNKKIVSRFSLYGINFFILLLFITLISKVTHAQESSSIENTCRSKAKEIAVQTYSNCVTESKNQRIEQIRQGYKQELQQLKEKYDRELKNLSGSKIDNTAPEMTAKLVKNPKGKLSTKNKNNVAKQLPAKITGNEALPVQNVDEQVTVTVAPSVEKEAQSYEDDLEVIQPEN
ncbi:MAG: hypothetical protein ACOYOK_12630 [Pseudobdellovibrionaceae bacterium]